MIRMMCLIFWMPTGAAAAGLLPGVCCACTVALSAIATVRPSAAPNPSMTRSLIPPSNLSRNQGPCCPTAVSRPWDAIGPRRSEQALLGEACESAVSVENVGRTLTAKGLENGLHGPPGCGPAPLSLAVVRGRGGGEAVAAVVTGRAPERAAERLGERSLVVVAHQARHVPHVLGGGGQVARGAGQAQPGEVADRRHADRGAESHRERRP